jgi:signal peptidase I, bacterial type
MEPNTQLTDQLANISPVVIVAVVLGLTLVRIILSKVRDGWARTVSETCDTVNFVLILAFLLIRPFVAQAFYIPSESMENTLLKRDRLIVDKFSYRWREPEKRDVVVFAAPLKATDGIPNQDYIKRLIAREGDTVQVKPPRLVIDGEVIDPLAEGVNNTHDYLRSRLGLPSDVPLKIFPDHLLVNDTDRVEKAQLAEKLGRPGAKIEMTPGQTIVNGAVLDEPYTKEDPDYTYPEDGGTFLVPPGTLFMMGDNRNHSKDSHIWNELDKDRVVGRAVVVFWPPSRAGAIR